MIPLTSTRCLVCQRPVEVEVPEAFLEAGLHAGVPLAACPDCAAKEHLTGGGLFIKLASQPPDAIFDLGRIAVTRGAVTALADARQHVHELLECHAKGDWGQIGHVERTDVTEEEIAQGEMATDRSDKLNKIALHTLRGQLMSSYRTRNGAEIWVITTLRNQETVVMVPDEY
jgi:hypothetical protein